MFTELLKKVKTAAGLLTDMIAVNRGSKNVFNHFSRKSIAEDIVMMERTSSDAESSRLSFGSRNGNGLELRFKDKN